MGRRKWRTEEVEREGKERYEKRLNGEERMEKKVEWWKREGRKRWKKTSTTKE